LQGHVDKLKEVLGQKNEIIGSLEQSNKTLGD